MTQLPVLTAEECEKCLRVIEITLQCKAIERSLSLKKHMAFVVHVQLCRQRHNNNCSIQYCNRAKRLLGHSINCTDKNCGIKLCFEFRRLIAHYDSCFDCMICSYAREMNSDEDFVVYPTPLFTPNFLQFNSAFANSQSPATSVHSTCSTETSMDQGFT
ncbi:hypothetical protein M3Y94_01107200 [Aphelenchoides besseyi]|nr:hypothetical protein M3Y94_01107200 [Aphelenchoides besseyi]KAI6221554.1 hypothetical protein M3Y95_00974400 [Aphelenchoides besseyi]